MFGVLNALPNNKFSITGFFWDCATLLNRGLTVYLYVYYLLIHIYINNKKYCNVCIYR